MSYFGCMLVLAWSYSCIPYLYCLHGKKIFEKYRRHYSLTTDNKLQKMWICMSELIDAEMMLRNDVNKHADHSCLQWNSISRALNSKWSQIRVASVHIYSSNCTTMEKFDYTTAVWEFEVSITLVSSIWEILCTNNHLKLRSTGLVHN